MHDVGQEQRALGSSLGVLLGRTFKRRVHFSSMYVGKGLTMPDQKQFTIIRDLKVDSGRSGKEPVAVFVVRFKFAGLPLAVNKRLSMIPAPFLIANPGFRQKIWSVSADGYFQGLYQWATIEVAKSYPHSFIFRLMTKRAVESTISFEILPDKVLYEYIKGLLGKREGDLMER